jgi:hypothetical protein
MIRGFVGAMYVCMYVWDGGGEAWRVSTAEFSMCADVSCIVWFLNYMHMREVTCCVCKNKKTKKITWCACARVFWCVKIVVCYKKIDCW